MDKLTFIQTSCTESVFRSLKGSCFAKKQVDGNQKWYSILTIVPGPTKSCPQLVEKAAWLEPVCVVGAGN